MSAGTREVLGRVLPPSLFVAPEEEGAYVMGGRVPAAVLHPSGVEEVGAALRSVAETDAVVLPVGRGTHPPRTMQAGRFVALGTAGLAGIVDYEPADLTATVAAGTSMDALSFVLSENGQWLPVDGPRVEQRTLGGIVATGASGPLSTAYGSVRDLVLGLTVVTGDGRALKLGGRVMKNVAGFDLGKLIVGSRGTLGVIVEVTVRLFPRPEVDRVVVARGRSADMLLLARRVATAPSLPASAVLARAATTRTSAGEAALILRLHGAEATVAAEERRILGSFSGPVDRLDGDEGRAFVAKVHDAAGTGSLVLRLSALPSRLGEVLGAATEALPDAAVAADPLTGRVRMALGSGADVAGDADRSAAWAAPLTPEELAKLAERVASLGGSFVVERAPPDLMAGVRSGPRRNQALSASIKAHFDPHGVLWTEGVEGGSLAQEEAR